MQLSEYPAQEPISEFARAYAEKVMQLGANIKGEDVLYGANPYQSLGIHKPLKGCGAVFMFIHGGGGVDQRLQRVEQLYGPCIR